MPLIFKFSRFLPFLNSLFSARIIIKPTLLLQRRPLLLMFFLAYPHVITHFTRRDFLPTLHILYSVYYFENSCFPQVMFLFTYPHPAPHPTSAASHEPQGTAHNLYNIPDVGVPRNAKNKKTRQTRPTRQTKPKINLP